MHKGTRHKGTRHKGTIKKKKLSSAGWSKEAPGTRERKTMKKKCGNKCFLGPTNESSFPICTKGTCKINSKGIYAAYVRAREYGSAKIRTGHKHTKKLYHSIAARAKKMLIKRGFGSNLK
jgi:hypothetical protein